MAQRRRYRVIQWATGTIGTASLRGVLDHPDFDLVGLYVTNPEKDGRDAGELCGRGATGVEATRNIDDILALDADCVLYMPRQLTVEDVTQLLASGKNVSTTRVEFHHPPSMPEDLRRAVEAACKEGGTSLHGTGSSPGFATEALPIPLLSMQRRLDRLTVNEYADVASRRSPEIIFDIMGFGAAPETFDASRAAHLEHSFAGSMRQLADAIGKPIERFQTSAEVAVTRGDVEIAAGMLGAGTIGAQRISITGFHAGEPLFVQRLNWYCTREVDGGWDLRETGWRVQVDGDTPLDVSITLPVAPENFAATTPGLTAHRAVNAVPAICAASPGLRTTLELPHILPLF